MEPTKFTCPQCSAILKTKQQIQSGQSITCPKCGASFHAEAIVAKVAATIEAGSPTMTFSGEAVPAAPPARGENWADERQNTTTIRRSKRVKKQGSGALVWLGVSAGILVLLGGAATGFAFWVSNLLKTPDMQVVQVKLPPTPPPLKTIMPPAAKQQVPPVANAEDGNDQPEEEIAPETRRAPKFPDGTPWVGIGVGNIALEIDGEDLDGKRFRLSEYRGKVVLLDFWADWCVYCRKMYDHEKGLVQRFADKPFALVGVNTDAQKSQAKRAVQQNGLNWRSWWDGRSTGMPICDQWGVTGYPKLYVLDHKGKISNRIDGMPQDLGALDKSIEVLVEAALKESTRSPTSVPEQPTTNKSGDSVKDK